MRYKGLAIGMMLFLVGTTYSICFLPMGEGPSLQNALSVARVGSEKGFQEFASVLTKVQRYNSTSHAVQSVVSLLLHLLGASLIFYAVSEGSFYIGVHFLQASVYFTPRKAKKLKRFWDDIG